MTDLTCGYFLRLFLKFSSLWCASKVWRSSGSSRFWRFELLWRYTQVSTLRREDWETLRRRKEEYQEDQWCSGMKSKTQTENSVFSCLLTLRKLPWLGKLDIEINKTYSFNFQHSPTFDVYSINLYTNPQKYSLHDFKTSWKSS